MDISLSVQKDEDFYLANAFVVWQQYQKNHVLIGLEEKAGNDDASQKAMQSTSIDNEAVSATMCSGEQLQYCDGILPEEDAG